jgi:hypothetical protein
LQVYDKSIVTNLLNSNGHCIDAYYFALYFLTYISYRKIFYIYFIGFNAFDISLRTISFSLGQSYPLWRSSVSTSASYSRGPGLSSRRQETNCRKFLCGFPPAKLELAPQIIPRCLFSRHLQFIIHESSYHLMLYNFSNSKYLEMNKK